MRVFEQKRIVLGVTGSIAAYKSVTLASSLTKAGALVDVILTDAATKLVAPITFSSVTGRKAYIDEDLWKVDDHVLHIELGEKNDAFLIAPATANTIAKIARGMADNLLSLTALASRTSPLIAPAMDGGMYSHPATQNNLDLLNKRGVGILGPAAGHLASGLSGIGRMLEPDQLLGHLRCWLGRNGILKGKKVLITAGGTQEPIDPVRVISNRSSGKQGFAIAQAALDQGAEVILISAPVVLSLPVGARLITVKTASEMAEAVFAESGNADILIMAAAVADYKPTREADQKIKKDQGGLDAIQLERTVDILKEVANNRAKNKIGPAVVIGFAAETENLLENAKSKLENKNLDLIAANDVSRQDRGIGSDKNQVTLIWKDGQTRELPVMDKSDISDELILEAAKLLV
ncbi:MAG: bifunctional phosphopantothenoylcysteine decarboxylase/phosphopantothenate--cysteine ligase CoaBC [Chloroflexota bacterium]|nr:MAG: bifunctional phosphopantothenoylcysteine decarboxylase/phosphopantothenate--cysteine ligase CoaBC [Chloroflexota bacterium]HDD62078.1 bifunctional phosphopantothenoylcysteine decarboxylase/phosphopantothenate--cysteine ligase CoaBC [Chloroflexota bacterium]